MSARKKLHSRSIPVVSLVGIFSQPARRREVSVLGAVVLQELAQKQASQIQYPDALELEKPP